MRRTVRERPGERSDTAVLTRRTASPADQVLDLQRSAGNASVTAMLARQTAAAPAALPTAEELTSRISNCIGVWETNRGGDAPNPRESSLDTVAGVKASMATIEQATMPYALDALRRHVSLRNLAEPPLTREEIDAAILRVQAVPTLLTAINTAANAGTTPDDFIRDQQARITPTGLTDENVRTMFSAVELKQTIDTKHGELSKTKTPQQAAAEIPAGGPARARRRLAVLLHPHAAQLGREPRRVAAARGQHHAGRRRRARERGRDLLRRHGAGRAGGARPGGRAARADPAADRAAARRAGRPGEQPERDELRRERLGHVPAAVPR